MSILNGVLNGCNEEFLALPDGMNKAKTRAGVKQLMLGRRAHKVIVDFMKERGLCYSGGKIFYSPMEWADRGETTGRGSVLVIIHEDADIGIALDHDRAMQSRYVALEELSERLAAVGCFAESINGWSTAIYAI